MRRSNEMEELEKYFPVFLKIVKNQSSLPSIQNQDNHSKSSEPEDSKSNNTKHKNMESTGISKKESQKTADNQNIDRSIEEMAYIFDDQDSGIRFQYIKVILTLLRKGSRHRDFGYLEFKRH